jgi:hypothetical protein
VHIMDEISDSPRMSRTAIKVTRQFRYSLMIVR